MVLFRRNIWWLYITHFNYLFQLIFCCFLHMLPKFTFNFTYSTWKNGTSFVLIRFDWRLIRFTWCHGCTCSWLKWLFRCILRCSINITLFLHVIKMRCLKLILSDFVLNEQITILFTFRITLLFTTIITRTFWLGWTAFIFITAWRPHQVRFTTILTWKLWVHYFLKPFGLIEETKLPHNGLLFSIEFIFLFQHFFPFCIIVLPLFQTVFFFINYFVRFPCLFDCYKLLVKCSFKTNDRILK